MNYSVGIVDIVVTAAVDVTRRDNLPSVVVVERERRFSPVGIVGYDIVVVVVDVTRRQHVTCTVGTNRDRRFSPVGTADIAVVAEGDDTGRGHVPRNVAAVRERRS